MNKRPTMLSATFVKSVNVPGRYGDGRGGLGLTLLVKPSSRRGCRKSWGQSIRINGRKTTLGLGTYPVITLAMARERALENARAIAQGRDPRRASNGVPTFAKAAEIVLAIHAVNWKPGSRSEETWRSSLRDYALPRLGSMRVDAVTTRDVMAVLLPIWSTKRETARRLRHRVGAVMKWAVAQGYRVDNPAGDAISAALPKTGARIEHRKALPHVEVGAALERVRASGAYQGLVLAFEFLVLTAALPKTGVRVEHRKALPHVKVGVALRRVRDSGAYRGLVLAFEFLVLTAARSGEVRGARWSEIDMDAAVWTVPGERMKAGREHRVPLANRALALLDEARQIADGSALVFPTVTGRAPSQSGMSMLLRQLGIAAVPHGFRSSFRDWAAECTEAPREVCELALAHVNNDRVEAAYRRSDLFDRRRELMQQWADYLAATA